MPSGAQPPLRSVRRLRGASEPWTKCSAWVTADSRVEPSVSGYLRCHCDRHLDVEGKVVRARWNDMGEWQSITLNAAARQQGQNKSVLKHVELRLSGAGGLGLRVSFVCILWGPQAAVVCAPVEMSKARRKTGFFHRNLRRRNPDSHLSMATR